MKFFRLLIFLTLVITIFSCRFKSKEEIEAQKYSKFSPEDKKEILRLESVLEKSNLGICEMDKIHENTYIDCVHEADKKYPVGSPENLEYSQKLFEEKESLLTEKYGLSTDDFGLLSLYAYEICR